MDDSRLISVRRGTKQVLQLVALLSFLIDRLQNFTSSMKQS